MFSRYSERRGRGRGGRRAAADDPTGVFRAAQAVLRVGVRWTQGAAVAPALRDCTYCSSITFMLVFIYQHLTFLDEDQTHVVIHT
jgi:hypothetical protein